MIFKGNGSIKRDQFLSWQLVLCADFLFFFLFVPGWEFFGGGAFFVEM